MNVYYECETEIFETLKEAQTRQSQTYTKSSPIAEIQCARSFESFARQYDYQRSLGESCETAIEIAKMKPVYMNQ